MHRSRSNDAVIRVYDDAANVIPDPSSYISNFLTR